MASIASVPDELLEAILLLLDKHSQTQLSISSRWAYNKVLPYLWQTVELVDDANLTPITREDELVVYDYHDDTRLIKKLTLLAK